MPTLHGFNKEPRLIPTDQFSDRVLKFGRTAGALVSFIFGSIVLVGWIVDSRALKGAGFWGDITVKTNAGLMMLSSGLALLIYNLGREKRNCIFAVRLISSFIVGISVITFAEHIFDSDFGIDQALFSEVTGELATSSPNRMGPPASVCFTLYGAALLLLLSKRSAAADLATALSALVGLIALIPSLGYLLGANSLYTVAGVTGIALPTALALLAVSFGLILSADDSRYIKLFRSGSAGGVLLRRLLLPAILLPPLLCIFRKSGQTAGLFDERMGEALLIIALVYLFSVLIWLAAGVIDQIDMQRRQLIDSERTARSASDSANRFKDQFLTTISHELRTPLNAILGWSQVMRRANSSVPEIRRGIETIERNARLQTQLINDLLDLSRAISGKLKIAEAPLDIQSLLLRSIQAIQPSAEQKGVTITHHFDPGVGTILGDSNRLQQVFGNLLTNAIKFTPKSGLIHVSLAANSGEIEISVKDTGQGIRPEFLSHLFERFSQAESGINRRHGGLGIGLSIAKDLVVLHGGTIKASSLGEGHGAEFVVTLPRSASFCPDNSALNKPLQSLKGIRILIVDDEPDSLDALKLILEDSGAKVLSAQSAEKALELLPNSDINLLISDIGMPEIDGYQFMRIVRQSSIGGQDIIPAIALTAFAREEDRKRSIEAGYQIHLIKPLDPAALITAVSHLIRPASKSETAPSIS